MKIMGRVSVGYQTRIISVNLFDFDKKKIVAKTQVVDGMYEFNVNIKGRHIVMLELSDNSLAVYQSGFIDG